METSGGDFPAAPKVPDATEATGFWKLARFSRLKA